mmetsp:Transcript_16547/g.44046  ORF Transcript_16547/g.44046 Transcript_16547/m.44046 type:complete len:218 (-) Transcript_16547:16-669(-)
MLVGPVDVEVVHRHAAGAVDLREHVAAVEDLWRGRGAGQECRGGSGRGGHLVDHVVRLVREEHVPAAVHRHAAGLDGGSNDHLPVVHGQRLAVHAQLVGIYLLRVGVCDEQPLPLLVDGDALRVEQAAIDERLRPCVREGAVLGNAKPRDLGVAGRREHQEAWGLGAGAPARVRPGQERQGRPSRGARHSVSQRVAAILLGPLLHCFVRGRCGPLRL